MVMSQPAIRVRVLGSVGGQVLEQVENLVGGGHPEFGEETGTVHRSPLEYIDCSAGALFTAIDQTKGDKNHRHTGGRQLSRIFWWQKW